ncbi:MFS transporter [Paenibacillus spongiae]|uniref:MFS transporter n=1 Tax=Paenibacillus spongiae TaxID=2909671 RepID=A0ABY5S783_9BACL|nr:MFS transporter [Paenibacillus spongiae]UVI28707.1 MFS transporter [Paenibacillus spongiae]
MGQGKYPVKSGWFTPSARGKWKHETIGRTDRNPDSRVLDGQSILLLAVQGLLGIANALSGTFVPVYLWKASQSFALIGWFNFSQYAVSGLTFWIAGKWVKEHNKMNSLRLGVALSGAFYFTVLLLGKSAATYAIPLGILNGIALGCFWLSFNVVYFEVTEPGNRDRFNGWAGFLGSGAGILAPWISGTIIMLNKGERGYTIIFTIAVIIFAIAVILSFWLKKRKTVGEYEWLMGIRQLATKGSPWRRIVPSIAAQGVRESVFMFLIGLLVFIATNNEQKLGSFSLITSLVALGSFLLIGKLLTPSRRRIAMLIGAAAIGVFVLPLFWPMNYGTLLVFGIGTAIFMPLYTIPMTSVVFDMIGQSEESAKQREEFIVLREASLTIGRLLGLSCYLIILPYADKTPQAIPWLLFSIGLFPLIGWLFIRTFLGRSAREAS